MFSVPRRCFRKIPEEQLVLCKTCRDKLRRHRVLFGLSHLPRYMFVCASACICTRCCVCERSEAKDRRAKNNFISRLLTVKKNCPNLYPVAETCLAMGFANGIKSIPHCVDKKKRLQVPSRSYIQPFVFPQPT